MLLATLALTSCSTEGGGRKLPRLAGSALDSQGPQDDGGTFIRNPKSFKEYWFAFPVLRNGSADDLTITSFRLAAHSKHVLVRGYSTYKATVLRDGIPQVWERGTRFPGGLDLASTRYRADLPEVVKAGRVAHAVGVARLSRDGSAEADGQAKELFGLRANGCVVEYTQRSRMFRQKLQCEFGLGG